MRRYRRRASTVLGCIGTWRDLANLVCRMVSMPGFRSTSASQQMHRLGDPQTGRGDQTEQRLVGRAAQARRGTKTARGGQQVDDLLLAVDVRCQSLADPAEDRVVGHLGARLELLQPAVKERSSFSRRAQVAGSSLLPLSRRAQSAMTSTVSGPWWPRPSTWRAKLRNAIACAAQLEAQAATLAQVVRGVRLQ